MQKRQSERHRSGRVRRTPGLRAFTTEEGPIFFGRGREVDALIARLREPAQQFLAVVGASGTGKSSLIRAGLIPRLQDGAIEGSQDWRVVTCTPGGLGDNPFLALAVELKSMESNRNRGRSCPPTMFKLHPALPWPK